MLNRYFDMVEVPGSNPGAPTKTSTNSGPVRPWLLKFLLLTALMTSALVGLALVLAPDQVARCPEQPVLCG